MSPRTSMSTSSSRFNWGGPSSESESDSPIPHQSWSFIKSSRIISMNPIAATKGNWMSEWIGLGGKIKGMKVNAKSRARIREKERLIAGTVAGRRARSQSVLGSKFLARTMVFLPEETWGIIAFLLCFAAFATVMTLTLKHVLNPDKEPLPWRSYCQSPHPTLYSLQDPNSLSSTTKRPGPHTSTKLSINSFAPNSANQVLFPFVPDYTMQPAEEFNPVGVLIGVFTTDEGVERRNMIRQSYGSHPRSRRLGTEGVRIKFVMGRPRRKYQKAIQLEMEAFNDILLLDMPENMNSGKTHAFFSWAAENATIPDWEYPLMLKDLDDPVVQNPIYRGERRPEYVVKADEDSFIMLGELERRLRVVPRTKSYWGYLVKNTFMAGECYALSFDLVQYIAASPALRTLTRGKEDKLVSRWMKMHPERENIVWVAEKCWIYDHPKAGTVYSHGFLFPSTVDEIRESNSNSSYSSVSKFRVSYTPFSETLTPLQKIEALIEESPLSKSADDADAETIKRIYEDRPTRVKRFLGDKFERGGTVVVHYIKKQDWFLETMIALLGNDEGVVG